jgi:Kef-type K+ transport system membrane component KefB
MGGAQLFVVQAFVIVAIPYGIWHFSRLHGVVPCVVVQILAGIALGPSLLGRVAPDAYALLFGPATLGAVSGIASIAVLFFGFITGLHLDPAHFRNRSLGFVLTGAGSVLVPSALGALAGMWIIQRFPAEIGPNATAGDFVIAIGISAGVTALPVLGVILREMRLLDRVGQWALGLAALNDAALWILLAALLAGTATASLGALQMSAFLPIYLLAMIFAVRPLLGRTISASNDGLSDAALVGVLAVAIASSALTEAIGLHYIFGAFVAGAVVPDRLRRPILNKLEPVTVMLLLPFFFMLTGLKTTIDAGSPAFMEIFLIATCVAVTGKVAGTALPARLMGWPWREALALGVLMQTKGLMEVIVLTILLDSGIISKNAFSALILMAVISTAIVMPLTRPLLKPGDRAGL